MWIKLAACALFSFVTSLTAHAADYYAGKTITFIIGSAPGGGYDIYGCKSRSNNPSQKRPICLVAPD